MLSSSKETLKKTNQRRSCVHQSQASCALGTNHQLWIHGIGTLVTYVVVIVFFWTRLSPISCIRDHDLSLLLFFLPFAVHVDMQLLDTWLSSILTAVVFMNCCLWYQTTNIPVPTSEDYRHAKSINNPGKTVLDKKGFEIECVKSCDLDNTEKSLARFICSQYDNEALPLKLL